ncbi:MAG: nucleotidyltransferase domain-containing protein [Planctomycetota bacterium]|jgi:predicted nucleotidyltransferase
MENRILEALESLAQKHGVKIVYACESGSRAWGFASTDSDYDVRFLYLHPRDWYLSINVDSRRDVIEQPISDHLDISGWDLRKALRLFAKSNPPLYEWLGSPIVYLDDGVVAGEMRRLARDYYSPLACMYHYFSMAKGNNREYLHGEQVWLKKYFYVLRPVLAVIWLERELGVVPTEFEVLVEAVVESEGLRSQIRHLLAAKRAGQELDYGPRNPIIGDFIDQQVDRMERAEFSKGRKKPSISPLNDLFLSTLEKVWS